MPKQLAKLLESTSSMQKIILQQSDTIKRIDDRLRTLDGMNEGLEAQLVVHESFIIEKGLQSEFENFLESVIKDFEESQKPKLARIQ